MTNDKKRETLMNKVQMYSFAALECGLYLDGHPENRKALAKHAEYSKKAQEAVAEYEGLYGPLTITNAGGNDWNWVKGSWPWQNKEVDQ